jgi:D-amino peptidase
MISCFRLGHALIAFSALGACQSQSPPPATSVPAEPWTLEAVRPDTTDGIRVLVLHDMEGLSGQSNPQTFFFGTPQYALGQTLLAADVNAVIEGLYQGGATEVHVVDGHGSGNPEPDVRRDLLDRRATQILRDSAFDAYVDLVAPRAYDAVAVVGMHAKTGSGGFASHTYTLGIEFLIHGKTITETELVGLSWGRVGTPVIFGSGDDRLAADLATMPWLEFVTVKKAVAADSALPRPVEEARADLTASARRAMEKLRAGQTQAMKVTTPIVTAIRTVPPADLSVLEGVPGIDYEDGAVSWTADDLGSSYRGLTRLVGVATRAYTSVLFEQLRARPDWSRLSADYSQALEQRWFDVESGRWKRPEPVTPPARKHHGFR